MVSVGAVSDRPVIFAKNHIAPRQSRLQAALPSLPLRILSDIAKIILHFALCILHYPLLYGIFTDMQGAAALDSTGGLVISPKFTTLGENWQMQH